MARRSLVLLGLLVGCGAGGDLPVADAGFGGLDGPATADAAALDDAGALDDAAASDTGALGDAAALDAAEVDASAAADAASTPDAGVSRAPLDPCPIQGPGALIAPRDCAVFTAVQAGASAGDNADEANYALTPAGPPRDALVLYLNASLSSPARQIADPNANFYGASADAGFHVLALAYRSSLVVGVTCGNDPACYALTRESIITGVAVPGAPPAVADIQLDEGIVARLDAALRLLAANDPSAGWGQFIASPAAPDARDRIAWSRIIAAGHSQGGGHAAYLGRMFPLRRVVQLASTCDAASGVPAPWTHADASWATDPGTRYVGFAAPRDGICAQYAAVWQAMGLDPARQLADAAVCNGSGAHGGPIACTDNLARWPTLLID